MSYFKQIDCIDWELEGNSPGDILLIQPPDYLTWGVLHFYGYNDPFEPSSVQFLNLFSGDTRVHTWAWGRGAGRAGRIEEGNGRDAIYIGSAPGEPLILRSGAIYKGNGSISIGTSHLIGPTGSC